MPIGPNGEKRPADPIANAVRIGQIATRQAEETYVNRGQSAGGRKGGKSRAAAMTAQQRQKIAQEGARARWGK